MNFRFYLTTIIFFVIISCNDDEVVKKGSDKFIDFEVSDIRKFEYKGALINSVNDENFKNIGAFGYNIIKNFDETIKPDSSFLHNIEINKNDNDLVTAKKYYCPGEGSVSFFAYSLYGGENTEILVFQ